MNQQNILSELLQGIEDPKITVKHIIMESGIQEYVASPLQQLDITKPHIVCDQNTYTALGKKIEEITRWPCVILPGTPKADDKTIRYIKEKTQDAKALCAIGGGTINDLCKYSSHQRNIPYISFPTAPSMNGYLSANASITVNGIKSSLQAAQPRAVIADMDVISKAPKRLIQAGLGDSICRPTAQADWLLSHLLLNTPYDERPFNLLKLYEQELFTNADKLITGNTETVTLLMKTLCASGLGMVLAGGSYPASQGEHMIAHTMEMKYGNSNTYHGEQIAVTTLTMARLQEKIIAQNSISMRNPLSDKKPTPSENKLAEWPTIKQKLLSIHISASKLETILNKAACPTAPEAIGWREDEYNNAVNEAYHTRDRFTFLDLAPPPIS